MTKEVTVKEKSKKKTLTIIFDSFYELVMQASFDSVSLTLLSDKTLYSKASIYYYFESKQELLIKTMDHYRKSVFPFKMLFENKVTDDEFDRYTRNLYRGCKLEFLRLAAFHLAFRPIKSLRDDQIALMDFARFKDNLAKTDAAFLAERMADCYRNDTQRRLNAE